MLDTLITAWISRGALEGIAIEAERTARLETGGVLIGYCAGTADVVVTQSIGPGPKAVHGEIRFVPDADYHESSIAKVYAASGRRHVYLGDWHTHPGADVELSKRDCRVLKRIAETKGARMPHPIMGIVGGELRWSLAVWRYTPGGPVSRIGGRGIAECRIRIYGA